MVRRTTDRLRHAKSGVFVAAVLVMMLVGASVAFADHPDSSGFTIDGNVPDAGTTAFSDPSGNAKELGPINSNTTKLGVIHNDAVPTLGLSNPNGQVDLSNVWFDSASAGGTDWLYFAWQRDSTTGSGVIAIEFQQDAAPLACDYAGATQADLIAGCNPWANRQEGDFIIVWDQVGNDIQISVRTFDGTAFSAPDVLDAHEADAALSADTSRGEAVVDLGVIFPDSPTECLSIANVIPGTITGNSDTADYKDTVLADIAGAVSISNCGSLEVEKVDDTGAALQGAEFTLYTSDGDDDFEPGTDDAIAQDSDGVNLTCTTGANGKCTIDDILFGDYWIDETIVPANHDKPDDLPQQVTISDTTKLVLGPFENPRQRGSIIVEKVVADTTVRIDGASFAIDEDGDESTTEDQTPIPAVEGTGLFCIDDLMFGDYTVVETAAPTGYADASGSQSHTVDSMSDCETRLGGETVTADLTFENKAITSLSTTPKLLPNDVATLSGGFGTLTGSLEFELFANGDCSGDSIYEETVVVDAGAGDYATDNTSVFIDADGTYSWKVTYTSGDDSNNGALSACDAEQLVIDFTPLEGIS
jgi:hypothetical protein